MSLGTGTTLGPYEILAPAGWAGENRVCHAGNFPTHRHTTKGDLPLHAASFL